MKPSAVTPKNEKIDWDSTAWTNDGKFMAYVTKSKGSDWKTIRVKDLSTLQDLKDDILTHIKFSSPSWDEKNEGFFYSKYDDGHTDGAANFKIPRNRVYYHKLYTKQSEDILIYENLHCEECSYSVSQTDDQKYLILNTRRSTEPLNLKHFVDLSSVRDFNSKFNFYPIIDEWVGSFTVIHNEGTRFWFKTNYKAEYNRIVSFDILYPQEVTWVVHLVGDELNQI